MSFDKILASNVVRKEEEIKIGDYIFYAREMTYPLRLAMATAEKRDEQFFMLLSTSIHDADGNRMSKEQIENLPDEIAEKFFLAAVRVNTEVKEKN